MDLVAEREAREAAIVKENNAYLDDHPEVKQLLNDYISAALVEQPEDVFHFARDFFKGIAANVDEAADDEVGNGYDQDDLDDDEVAAMGGNPQLRAYLKSVFDSIDTDGSGTISQAELKKKLAIDTELQGLLEAAGGSGDWYVLEQLDMDGDGVVTWTEFESMLGDAH
ncbi:hypothetical protein Ctob_000732 [Chrysochromulina tobinii]|uniref:EF-hand domain-containing protein n=1 Tax=Chrysochromulina tobinii TaxID=1460289 RepID=A0A0M0J7K6_9EUKA|nr:hypothetical protein Ctob_000732 [Chrysochromulina tobinii]|eukprot:KOO22337.1 hypothetical protein Ctob_000732 [Chrysochromulina sp. CCMP291]